MPPNVDFNQDTDFRNKSEMNSTSVTHHKWPVSEVSLFSLSQDLWRRALRHAVTPLSNMSTMAALIQRCGHCDSGPERPKTSQP